MTGFLAYSLAGHDKGEIYFIIREAKEYVYVSDGLVRTVEKPKKKNKKHIQIIKTVYLKTDTVSVTNEEIKHLIKMYSRTVSQN